MPAVHFQTLDFQLLYIQRTRPNLRCPYLTFLPPLRQFEKSNFDNALGNIVSQGLEDVLRCCSCFD